MDLHQSHPVLFNEYLRLYEPDLPVKIKIFINLAEKINKLHIQNIIYNDLHPGNIRIDLSTLSVLLCPSELSFSFSEKYRKNFEKDRIQGEIAYISPERTGCTNHCVDYRSDLYSLGVLFYEALTGVLPFKFDDPARTLHGHIAMTPDSIHKINNELPPILSDITSKLLSKNAADRYQSIGGVISDLSHCLHQLEKSYTIRPFPVAKKDLTSIFEIPNKLYGRYTEIKLIMDEYQLSSNGEVGMVFFSGPLGIGKSYLINKIPFNPMNKLGTMIHGKFDQYMRTIPYSAICEAFTQLAHQILTMDDEWFDRVRIDILEAVGNRGQIIIDAIPELELVIGKQPPVERLSPLEDESRFNAVILSFIRSIARRAKPLILFLDDLHWADSASLKLIKTLLTDTSLSNLLFIGCYRDIEANDNPALGAILDTLKSDRPSNFVALEAVDDDFVGMLLEDILSIDAEFHRDLVQFVVRRTSGNPLFIREFLINLHAQGWIRFVHGTDDPLADHWDVDMEGMLDAQIPETVVDLLSGRFLKQPPAVQELLTIAACVGTLFDATLLARVTGKKVRDIHLLLNQAIKQSMIIETGKGYKFIHDRVQETAYHLNNQDERAVIHHAIGKVLKEGISVDNPEDHLFLIVSQLDNARKLLDPQDRYELTVFSLKACQKAKRVTAYANALAYINISLELLADNSWEEQYDLTLSIHTEAARVSAIIGDIERVKQIACKVSEKAKSIIDTVKVHESLIWGFTSKNMHAEAVAESLRLLKQLGFSFHNNPDNIRILWEAVSTYLALKVRSKRSLIRLKDASNIHFLAASRIMQIIYPSVQALNIKLFILLVLRGIKLSLKHGNTPDTAIRFAVFGGLLCCNTRAVDSGYRLGQLASELASRPHTERNKAETQAFINGSIRPWKHHLSESLRPMLRVYNLGMATGSAARIGAISWYCSILFFTGEPLKRVMDKINCYNETLERYKIETFLIQNKILLQSIQNLSGLSESPIRLSGDAYDEEKMMSAHISGKDQTSLLLCYFYRMYLNYMFGDYDVAVEIANELSCYPHTMMATFYTVLDCFYDSLSRLAWIRTNTLDKKAHAIKSRYLHRQRYKLEKKWHLEKIEANQKRMKKWAKHAPMNIMNKLALVKAERASITANKEQAVSHYQQAISLSREHLFLQEEALANELLARFYLAENNPEEAKSHLRSAHSLYEEWGASAKCRQLEQEHRHFLVPYSESLIDTDLREMEQSRHPPALNLSALAVQMLVDASKLITTQNEIENYFSHLFDIIIRYLGGQRVLLLINQKDRLAVGIDYHATAKKASTLNPFPEKNDIFPMAIVKYVMRTNKKILLANAYDTKLFSSDPYIKRNQVKSVICLPVNRDCKRLAILYIENNLNYGVFKPQSYEILISICDHIALSFENKSLKETIMRLSEKNLQASTEGLIEILQSNHGLTRQEAKVASLFKEGYTRVQVCEELSISLKTLRRHLQSIYNKTINLEDSFNGDGRIDKLSRLILFLFKQTDPQ